MAQGEVAGTLRSRSEVQPLGEYLGALWRRREFTISLATGELRGRYLETLLGNLWHVLTPLLLMAVYWLIFGVILGTDRGVENFVGFLAVGVFTFGFSQRTITACGGSITNNIGLIRSLQFPRAVLPMAAAIRELASYGFAVTVMVFIILATGDVPSLRWAVAPVIVVLMTMFSAGLGLVVARLSDHVRDVTNLLPFLFRFAFYFSGIIFWFPAFVTDERVAQLGLGLSGEQVRHLLVLNPFFTYVELLRDSLLSSYEAEHLRDAWVAGALMAPVMLLIGIVYFRRGEGGYGRG